jgi:hypothetical protein
VKPLASIRALPGHDSLWSERIRQARSALLVALHGRAHRRAQMVAGDLESLAALSADNALEAAAKVAEYHGCVTVAAEIRSLKIGP